MKLSTSLLAVVFVVAGCAGPGSHASASPSPRSSSSPASPPASGTPTSSALPTTSPASSPAASPIPLTGAFAVLATRTSADTYNVSIVAPDGKVVASAQPSSPTAVTCGDAAAAVVPLPISTSNDRAYFMDAQGVVRFLTVQGDSGRATNVPTGGGRRSMFAVSPDDQRIAVIVNDYTASGVSIKLYIEDLNGGTNRTQSYAQSGAFGLWPIGWHGTDSLVVAKVPACTQGGGPFCCGPVELHVVDPATFDRRFTVGGASCVITGAPSPAGAVCEDMNYKQAFVVDWTGATQRSFAVTGPTSAFLSPNGSVVALVSGTTTTFKGASKTLNMQACGWIDATHVISGGDVQQQPRIGNVGSGGVVPVSAQGICAGRLPGGL